MLFLELINLFFKSELFTFLVSFSLFVMIPLGASIPSAPHAVSVSLPAWKDNVDYEEGDPRVADVMETGYPRFFVHRAIQQVCLPFLACTSPVPSSFVQSRSFSVWIYVLQIIVITAIQNIVQITFHPAARSYMCTPVRNSRRVMLSLSFNYGCPSLQSLSSLHRPFRSFTNS